MASADCVVFHPSDKRERDFVRQIATVAAIRASAMGVESYREEFGSYPTDLDELVERFGTAPQYISDGWCRPLVYFRHEHGYILASFGKSGVPEAQRVDPPTVVVPEQDFETDVVLIDGEWVQTPSGVDL